MKHKTWFRLVLKAIGVAVIAFAIPSLVNFAAGVASELIRPSATYMIDPHFWLPQTAWICTSFAIGLYLLFGGRWLVDKVIPSNRPYCPDCGYDLSHGHGERCPECGVTLPKT